MTFDASRLRAGTLTLAVTQGLRSGEGPTTDGRDNKLQTRRRFRSQAVKTQKEVAGLRGSLGNSNSSSHYRRS